jgi:hypothetical protein
MQAATAYVANSKRGVIAAYFYSVGNEGNCVVRKTFLALGLEFGAIAALAFSLAAICGPRLGLDLPYSMMAPAAYELSDPATAATAF